MFYFCPLGVQPDALACAIPGAGGSGSKLVLLLLALAVGYWVLVLSQQQERPLNLIGRIIGGIIILVSLVALICKASCGIGMCKNKYKSGNGISACSKSLGADSGAVQADPALQSK